MAPKQHPDADEAKVTVKTRLHLHDATALRERAASQNRSIAQHVAWLIQRDLEQALRS